MDNLARMLKLVNDIFDTRNDSYQLDIKDDERRKLEQLHHAARTEIRDQNGPILWLILIPTTNQLMNEFLNGDISERELFDKTPIGISYDAVYLCSALLLPEYRNRGIAQKATIEAINNIRKDHPIKELFVWPFSKEGHDLALAVAKHTGLNIIEKTNNPS